MRKEQRHDQALLDLPRVMPCSACSDASNVHTPMSGFRKFPSFEVAAKTLKGTSVSCVMHKA